MRLFPVSGMVLLTLLALGRASLAQEIDAENTPELELGSQFEDSSAVRWSFTPFAWALSLDGDTTIHDFSAPVDIAFIDVLTESDTLIPLMGHLEMGTDEWSLFLTTTYVHVGFEDSASVGNVDVEAEFTSNLAWFDLGGAIPLIDQHSDSPGSEDDRTFRLDAYAGARITVIDLELETDATIFGIPQESAKRDLTEVWVEPIIGLRGRYEVSEDLFLHARGDVGGFGLGSDFSWHLMADVGFDFELFGNPSTAFIGYRAMQQDYSNGDFGWDVMAHGPIFGVEIRF